MTTGPDMDCCPKCGEDLIFESGRLDGKPNEEKSLDLEWCIHCGYWHHEKSVFIVCEHCKGKGHISEDTKIVGQGKYTKKELERKIDEVAAELNGEDNEV